MKRCSMPILAAVALLGMIFGGVAQAAGELISGAGATFPNPIYSQWAKAYNDLTGVKINYQSIGSGGGIAQIKAKTVDFGASDAPLKKEELDKAGLIQFPMVVGGVVPVVNVKGIEAGKLKLSGETLANIYLGKIVKWNDEAIQADNPGLALPAADIAVVHRSDGSGTTWIFTNYLDKASAAWHSKVGTDKAVAWPLGMGGKGNEGVAAYVQRIPGAVGYVELAYAMQNKMAYVQLKNKAGKFVEPTLDAFAAAAANADWAGAAGYYLVLTDQPGEASWPITGASFILIYKNQSKPEIAKAVLKFFDWSYKNGQESAKKLDYVPIPDSVVKLVEATWSKDVTAGGSPLWP
jgi:phosphate transport system substrate-binding protein